MNKFLATSGLLLLVLLVSGLGTAIGATLHNKKIWIPSLIILVIACIAACIMLFSIGLIM